MPKKMNFHGLPLVIEYKKGEIKKNKDRPFSYGWEMYADYGYIEGTISNEEGEEMDCYVGPDRESTKVFYAPMLRDDPEYSGVKSEVDEIKVLLGFKDCEAAKSIINMQYGSWRVGEIMEVSLDDLKEKISLERIKNSKEKLLIAAEGIGGTTAPELNTGKEYAPEPRLVIQT